MPRFFITSSDVFECGDVTSGRAARVTGADANHILKVLRARTGERFVLCDENGIEYDAVFSSAEDKESCLFEIESDRKCENEPPYHVTVYQAEVKGDKFDTVVMKGTELGASCFVPFSSERCVMKIDPKDANKKTERWQRIAFEAAKQCGRGIIPDVKSPVSFKEAIKNAEGVKLFCYEGEGTLPITKVLESLDERPEKISLFIGPEGGFSQSEVEYAKENGAYNTGLGKRILRTETASSFVLSCLSCEYEL